MKRISIIFLFIILSVSMFAQNEQSTITLKGNFKLKEFFKQVEQQTNYSIAYKKSDVNEDFQLNLLFKHKPLAQAMKTVLSKQNLTYKIKSNKIFVFRCSELVRVSGKLFDNKTFKSVQYSSVVLLDFNNREIASAMTDSSGYYNFAKIVPGNYNMKVTNILYTSKTVAVNLNQGRSAYRVNLSLEGNTNQIREVVVSVNEAKENILTPQMGHISMTQEEIKNVPTIFGEADIVKSLQTQPGVSAGTEGLAGMYVRGGENDQNLMMIDGIPLYQMNHLGGLFSPFNVDAIKNIDFYKSAFPANYGGRLSSVLDIHTKDGDMQQYHGSVGIGLTSGNINVEGPIIKNRTSFNASIRRSWFELMSAPALAIVNRLSDKDAKKITGRYNFMDVNLKLKHIIDQSSKLSFILYYGSDYLKLNQKQEQAGTNEDGDNYQFFDDNRNKFSWGNFLSAFAWDKQMGTKFNMNLTASFTHYNSVLDESTESKTETDSNGKSEQFYKKNIQNGINDVGLQAHFTYRSSLSNRLKFGIDYTNHDYCPDNVNQHAMNGSMNSSIVNVEKIAANEIAPFVLDEWDISRLFSVNVGLRLTNFRVKNKSYLTLEPRFSGRALLTKDLSFKVSYARMNQFVQQISDSYISLPTDFWMPVSGKLKPLRSDQFSAGLFYNLKNHYSFSLEGYYKKMNNLLEYKNAYQLMPYNTSWEDKLTAGKGSAYGLDFSVQKQYGRLKGTFSYGLMWTDRLFKELNRGRHFPAKYDNRHKINLALSYTINKKIDINMSWVYMTGNRMTIALDSYQNMFMAGFPENLSPYYVAGGYDERNTNLLPYYDKKNNVRMPAYHRLDLGINIYQPHKKHRMGIWNVSLYNAYSRMNPIAIQRNSIPSGRSDSYYPGGNSTNYGLKNQFMALAIFPIIPSVSYTYKF